MAFFLSIILCCFVGQLAAQQNTYIKVLNPNQLNLNFIDYLTQDSLHSSNYTNFNFTLENENQLKTLIVTAKKNSISNIVILNNDSLLLEFNNNNKLVFTDKTNLNFQLFKSNLDSLKNNNLNVNNYVFNFMYTQPNLLMTLEYVKLGIVYNLHSLDSLKILFENLSLNVKKHQFYNEVSLLLTPINKLKKGDKLPSYEVIDINNNILDLKINKQASILVFWASWCKPCLNEIEEIVLHKEYFKNYEIILINIDENIENWNRRKYNYNMFLNYHLKNGLSNIMARELEINKIPTNVLLTKNGEINYNNINIFKKQINAINFYYNSNTFSLNNKQKETIDSILNHNKVIKIEIYGFTDNVGSKKDNKILAQNRIDEISKYINLKQNSILKKEYNIGAIENSNDKKSLNRRTEIKFYSKKPNLQFNEEHILIFKHLKYIIDSKNRTILLKILSEIRTLKNFTLQISAFSCGHENRIKYNSFNYSLSKARADILKRYFIKNGVNEKNIVIKDNGIDNTQENNNYKHDFKRRVEIMIEKSN